MPNPYLKRTALAANTAAAVAEAPVDRGLRCHVNVLNRGASPARFRLFIDDANTPSAADYVEYDAVLLPGQPVRNWPLVLPAGFKVYVRVDSGDCNVVAWGEEDFPAVIA